MTADPDRAGRRAAARRMWATGDYPTVAARLRPVALRLVDAAGVAPGDRVLDVGCGSGSVTIAAAARGAEVVGMDHIDAWFDVLVAGARDAGVAVDLVLGDAEQQPWRTGAFDVVLSSFAHIFAPDHAATARQLAATCRAGGTVAFTAWERDASTQGATAFQIITRELAAAGLDPGGETEASPQDWGDAEHIAARFDGTGVSFAIERDVLRWRFPSEAAFADFLLTASGPYILARDALRSVGRWDDVWAEIRAANREHNVATDGGFVIELPFVIALGHKTG